VKSKPSAIDPNMDFEDAKKVAMEMDPKLHFIEFLQFVCHIALVQAPDYD